MRLNMLVIVPEDLDVTNPEWQASNAGAAWELSQVLTTYTADKTPDTEPQASHKVIHCILTLPTMEDPLTYLNALITIYGLDWEIIGLQSLYNEIDAVWDETDPENPVLVSPAMAKSYLAVDKVKLFPYLRPRYDGEEPPNELAKALDWTHKYNGMADWI